jgi:hypothetical protein
MATESLQRDMMMIIQMAVTSLDLTTRPSINLQGCDKPAKENKKVSLPDMETQEQWQPYRRY